MNSFDEWYREAKKLNNDGFSAKDFFKAGQQSKQAEVDELQLKLSEDSRVLHNVIDIERKKCEELQKRIDESIYDLQHIESAMWEEQVEHVLRILKGNTNEH